MIKLSVIVPVYNVEDYIEECIESIVKQSIDSMEIIVVDDGSTDNSISIVEKFDDNRIKIIRKENGGLSSARNAGIREARGKYIYFIDSDDYLAYETALEDMYNIGVEDDADIVVGNAIKYYSEEMQYIFRRDKELFVRTCMDSSDFLIKFRKSYSMHVAVWLNMYKKDILDKFKISFKEGFYHEDEDFTPRIFLKAKNISIYPVNFYIYRVRDNSIVRSKNIKNANDIIKICLDLQEEFDNLDNFELKKIMCEYNVELLMRTSYEYRLNKIDKKVKRITIKGSYNKKLKLHSTLYYINNNLYYKFLDIKGYKR